jgi:hypothetical protein
MLGELCTSLLSPKNYYKLCTKDKKYAFDTKLSFIFVDAVVVEELHHLELYPINEFEHNRGSHDLHKVIQYAGNILPRFMSSYLSSL